MKYLKYGINCIQLLLVFLLLSTISLKSQQNSREDLIGTWEVSKCELYSDGKLIKTGIYDRSAMENKIVEGKYAGKIEDDVNRIIKEILGGRITFNPDSTASADVSVNGMSFSNEYWQLNPSGEILICKYENRARLKPLLFIGRIIFVNRAEIRVDYFESGFEIRIIFSLV